MPEGNHGVRNCLGAAPARALGPALAGGDLFADLQYGCPLFVDPIHVKRGWILAKIQWAFSLFIATETWLTPAASALVDRIGPRRGPSAAIAGGSLLVGLGWVMNANATSLVRLYAGAAVSGTGAGTIYATCVGNAVKTAKGTSVFLVPLANVLKTATGSREAVFLVAAASNNLIVVPPGLVRVAAAMGEPNPA